MHENADFSGSSLLESFPHSALVGSTVDTGVASVYEALVFHTFLRGCQLGSSPCPFTPAFPDEDVAALVFVNGGVAGFSGSDAPRAVLDSGMCKAVSACHAVFHLHGGRPKLFGILVGMDQRDSFHMHKPVVIPQVQFLDRLLRLLDEARVDSTVQFLDKVLCRGGMTSLMVQTCRKL